MACNSTIFIADAHLLPGENPRQAELLAKTLEACPDAGRVILLGDAFNLWVEKRGEFAGEIPTALEILKKYSERGIEIIHVSGNRDFVIGADAPSKSNDAPYQGFFGDGFLSVLTAYGIHPQGPSFCFEDCGKKILCLHGDALCTNDRLYQLLRRTFQGWPLKNSGKVIPLSTLLPTLHKIQDAPLRARDKAPSGKAAIVSSAAEAALEASQADLLVCGHVHFHESRKLQKNRELFILPAWFDKGEFAELKNGELIMRQV